MQLFGSCACFGNGPTISSLFQRAFVRVHAMDINKGAKRLLLSRSDCCIVDIDLDGAIQNIFPVCLTLTTIDPYLLVVCIFAP